MWEKFAWSGLNLFFFMMGSEADLCRDGAGLCFCMGFAEGFLVCVECQLSVVEKQPLAVAGLVDTRDHPQPRTNKKTNQDF